MAVEKLGGEGKTYHKTPNTKECSPPVNPRKTEEKQRKKQLKTLRTPRNFLGLQSPWPDTGVLTAKSLEVLREVLLGVLWEIGVLWGVLPRVLRETGGALGSA